VRRANGTLKAVKLTSRLQWKDGFGADSGPSQGNARRHAFRPTVASKAAISYVRFTSICDIESVAMTFCFGSIPDLDDPLPLFLLPLKIRTRAARRIDESPARRRRL
jgi:hypothetical protein